MNTKKIIGMTVGFCLAAAMLVGFGMSLNQPKTAFIELGNVHDAFEMKIELEARMQEVVNKRKHKLDSMEIFLKDMANELQSNKNPSQEQLALFGHKRDTFLDLEQRFAEDNEQLRAQYRDQIWKQLNQYVQEYGREKGFDFIHSANGDGSLMFADDAHDVSDEVSAYVNQKYNGQK